MTAATVLDSEDTIETEMRRIARAAKEAKDIEAILTELKRAIEITDAANKHVEQRFARAVSRWPRRIAARCDQFSPAPLACNDPHFEKPRFNWLRNLPRSCLRISRTAPRGKSSSSNGP